jgi:hypothetical protein
VVGAGVPGRVHPGKDAGKLLYVIHSGLPTPLTGRLKAYLKDVPEGYRFPAVGGTVRLVDMARAQSGMNVYYLEAALPAVKSGVFPVPEGEEIKVPITVKPAAGNRVPVVAFQPSEDQPIARSQVTFDGSASKDPEGGELIQYLWDFGDGSSARGRKVEHAFETPGAYLVSLTAIDDCGAYARYATTLTVTTAPSCSFTGTACAATSASLVFFASVVLIWWWRRGRAGRKEM